jgi:hypothetical protein
MAKYVIMSDYLSDDENENEIEIEQEYDEFVEEEDEELKAFEEQQMLEMRKILHEKNKQLLNDEKLTRSNSSNLQYINIEDDSNQLKRMASIGIFNQAEISYSENAISKNKSDSYLVDNRLKKKSISLQEFNKIYDKYKKRGFNARLPPYLKR